MITQLKTKTKVVYDSLKQLEDYIYLNVSDVSFNNENYNARIFYSVKNDSEEDLIIYSNNVCITKEQADQLYQLFHITGNTFTEQYTNLITAAAKFKVGNAYGLTTSDWE